MDRKDLRPGTKAVCGNANRDVKIQPPYQILNLVLLPGLNILLQVLNLTFNSGIDSVLSLLNEINRYTKYELKKLRKDFNKIVKHVNIINM